MKTTTITCDFCKADITSHSGERGAKSFRLHLSAHQLSLRNPSVYTTDWENEPGSKGGGAGGGAQASIAAYSMDWENESHLPFDGERYFCSFECVAKFISQYS